MTSCAAARGRNHSQGEGAKLPETKKSKRNPTREFRGPPDCPLTDALVKRKFADLDPETVRRAVPPKKRAVAETLGKSGAQDERRCVRFVRFVSDPATSLQMLSL